MAESSSEKSAQAQWPLQEIRTNPALVEHILDEFQSLKEKPEEKEIARIVLEYLTQRLNLVEKTDPGNQDDLTRMENFYDMAEKHITREDSNLLEKIFEASKEGYAELGNQLNSLFQDIHGNFEQKYGVKEEFIKEPGELEFRGRKVPEIAAETHAEIKKAGKVEKVAEKRANGTEG